MGRPSAIDHDHKDSMSNVARNILGLTAAFASALASAAQSASPADKYPERPIRVVVPFEAAPE